MKMLEGTKGNKKALFFSSNIGILLAFASLTICGALLSPVFLTVENLQTIAVQTSISAVVAVGMTFVIISGRIDLSVGSILAFSSMVAAMMIKAHIPWGFAVFAGLGVGVILGLLNGLIIGYLNLDAFVATLGTQGILRGLTLIICGGRPVYGMPSALRRLGTSYLGPIPSLFALALIVAVCGSLLLKHTRLGQYAYAVGGNERASRLSGVNVRATKVKLFIISGVLSAVAGIMLVARLGAAEPIAGIGYELDAIAAAVLGGASLSGGEGRVWGTIIGALLISALRNVLNLRGVQSYFQHVAIGAVIILAITIDALRAK
jgi:ribose/xylose/arabinose/galactoside ABC-type transport system permease subunit